MCSAQCDADRRKRSQATEILASRLAKPSIYCVMTLEGFAFGCTQGKNAAGPGLLAGASFKLLMEPLGPACMMNDCPTLAISTLKVLNRNDRECIHVLEQQHPYPLAQGPRGHGQTDPSWTQCRRILAAKCASPQSSPIPFLGPPHTNTSASSRTYPT